MFSVTRSRFLVYKLLVLSCSEFMVSYILFNVGCLVKVSLKLCFGDKVPTTVAFLLDEAPKYHLSVVLASVVQGVADTCNRL